MSTMLVDVVRVLILAVICAVPIAKLGWHRMVAEGMANKARLDALDAQLAADPDAGVITNRAVADALPDSVRSSFTRR